MLIVSRKVYVRILTERMMEGTERKVNKEQVRFREGRGCVNQIFAIKIIVEEYRMQCVNIAEKI